ncbi:MAG: transposase family protein [Firmicutes bacterium]|nr:transposase family protein [Bacillota bacterium]
MPKYSEELKNTIIAQMMPPENKSISQIARKTGLPEATLNQWRRKVRRDGHAAPADNQEAKRWNTQDKFLIVMETAKMNEAELAEYSEQRTLCRAGSCLAGCLYASQWRYCQRSRSLSAGT